MTGFIGAVIDITEAVTHLFGPNLEANCRIRKCHLTYQTT
jgi:hypothetical protein